jgi:hypothetical protein
MMSSSSSLLTWEVLLEFGFEPDSSVWSDIRPGLSLDFGNFKLTAGAVMNRRFQDVVVFGGTLVTPRTISMVEFEMPRQIESREKCAAWLAWNLDQHADTTFEPTKAMDWLGIGRANFRLLPWYFDQEAYNARPHCLMLQSSLFRLLVFVCHWLSLCRSHPPPACLDRGGL